MADPVLRIPVDDEAFQRYLAAFQRYQSELQSQPDMWADANEAVRDGVAANLALADSIGASVSAAIRLGAVQERNSQNRRREAEDQNADEQRASTWRRKSLDHVQELSRTTATVVRGFSQFATGNGTGGGLFSGISAIGKGLGGTLGGIVNLAGHALNAGYEINSAVSDKGQFARGIGATIGEQEGFRNNIGRYLNTDRGIDAVMNARGDPTQWAQFSMLGVDRTKGTNADVYKNVLRAQTALAKRHLDANGNIKFYETDPRGGAAFETQHEDLNRLVHAKDLEAALDKAAKTQSSLTDKNVDAATKSANASDNLTTKLVDLAQHGFVEAFNPALDKATSGLDSLYEAAMSLVHLLPAWLGGGAGGAGASGGHSGRTWGQWASGAADTWNKWTSNPIGAAFGAAEDAFGAGGTGGPLKHSTKSDVAAYRKISEFLRRQGFSDAVATGSAAGVIAESHGNSSAFNKSSGAIGIEQLLGDRKRAYLKMAAADGVKPHDMDEQLKFLAMELRGQTSEKGGKHVLAARTTDEALRAYVYKFMRPQGAHNEHLIDAQRDVDRGSAVVRAANVGVKLTVVAPPGHQTAVTVNSAAKGN